MRFLKSTIGIFLAAVMLLSFGAVAVSAAETPIAATAKDDSIVKGTGSNVWSFNKNTGELKIEKLENLDIFDFDDETVPGTYLPWKKYVKKIKTAIVGKKVKGIYAGCFADCVNLTQINLPDTLEFIGYDAFRNCTSLKKITIPESVTFIGESAFAFCTSLESIVISKNVKEMSYSPFYGCKALKNAKILGNIKELPYDCFGLCTSLTDVELPDSIETIAGEAFSGCKKLKKLTLPAGVKELGQWTFSDCKKLEDINLPEGLTDLGLQTFERCTSLKTITIPDSVTKIDGDVFADCTSLAEVKLGKNVTEIAGGAFYNTEIYNNPDNYKDGVLYIGDFLINAKKTVAADYKVSEGTKAIVDYAFKKNSALKSITIPASVKYVGNYSFSKCKNLETVTFSEGIKTIGHHAFAMCEKLSEVKLPDSVKKVKGFAFEDCTSVKKLTLGNKLKKIGYAAFLYCGKFKSIKIPESVTEIDEYAFALDVKSLTIVGVKDSAAEKYAKKHGLKFKDKKTGEVVNYIKKNPMKVYKRTEDIKASALKTKSRTKVVFDATYYCDTDKVKVSVVKSSTSKLLRNKVKGYNVEKGTVTFKKGNYPKGTYKLKLRFKVPAFLGYKAGNLTKTFKIKIK